MSLTRTFVSFAAPLLLLAGAARANDGIFPPLPAAARAVSFDGKGFLIHGRRTFLASGSIHYSRVPRALWKDRLLRLKRAGFNTVETYAFWNYHEPKEGKWDFSGEKDLGAFLDTAHEVGLYAIVRVGPYVCAEWDSGGYPVWLRFKPGLRVREDNPVFERYVDRWYEKVIPLVAKRQVNRGGPVVMVQLENEHPQGWGTEMPNGYFRHLLEKARSLGLEVPTFFSGLHHSHDPAGNRPWDNADRKTPWFSTEFWAGWYDRYGPADPGSLRYYDRAAWKILAYGGNGYNVYMLHGGTNFAQWNNQEEDASYDYGAAIGQAGDLRPLYYRFKRANLFAQSFPDILENSSDATAEFRDAVPGVKVTARKGTAGTLLFLDNPSDQPVTARLNNVEMRLQAGEIAPVVRDAAITPTLRVTADARVLLAARQGGVTTVVLYGALGEAGRVTFRSGEAESTLNVRFPSGGPEAHTVTVGADRVRVLTMDTRTADRTWLVDYRGAPWIVVGPDYVEGAVVRNGRLAFRAEDWIPSDRPVVAYGPDGAVRRYRPAWALTGAAAPALGAWETVRADREARPGFDDHAWPSFSAPPEMGLDGSISPYAWYRVTVDVPRTGTYQLHFSSIRDRFTLYINGRTVSPHAANARDSVLLHAGRNQVAVFAVHDGRDKLAGYLGPLKGVDPKGISGQVTLSPLPLARVNVTDWRWRPAQDAADAERFATGPAATDGWQTEGYAGDVFHGRRGFAVYRAVLPPLSGRHREVWFENVDDAGTVYLNGKRITAHRGWNQPFGASLDSAWKAGGPNELALVVENDDGPGGLFGNVEVQGYAGPEGAVNGTPVRNWRLRGADYSTPATGWARTTSATGAPAFYRTHFTLRDVPMGAVFRFSPGRLVRDMAWLNGHNLGRYPDRLVPDGLYLPACWLRAGANTLEVFDERGGSPASARIVIEQGASRTPVLYVEAPPLKTAVATAAKGATMIIPGAVWNDTDGKPIQAHGGGILARDGVYYWYGEDKTYGAGNAVGVSCYSSRDLLTWKNEGTVLPKDAVPERFRETGVLERPKVLYNAATGKYVMWMHLDADRYAVAQAGVAVSDKPAGPFTFVGAFRPVESSTFRDMNLFLDDDGRAYVFYAGEGNATMHIVRLNREYTAPEQPMVEGRTWARAFVGESREAPAPFKDRGRYYVITSGCTGWAPNAADISVADHIFGPWTSLGNPCKGPDAKTTFGAQSTYVLPAPRGNDGDFLFLADRWNARDLADSRYIWLPFHVGADGVTIPWQDRWDIAPTAPRVVGVG